MRYFTIVFALLLCLGGVDVLAAKREHVEKKDGKSNASVLAGKETPPLPEAEKSEEEKKVEQLLNMPRRERVTGVMAEAVEALEKKDIGSLDYGFYIQKMSGFQQDEYLELNTRLERKWFEKAVEFLTYLQKNKILRDQMVVAGEKNSKAYAQESANFNLVKKHLKKLVEKPDEASESVIKKQDKARQKVLKELAGIIKEQQKEALRKAKEEARKAKSDPRKRSGR